MSQFYYEDVFRWAKEIKSEAIKQTVSKDISYIFYLIDKLEKKKGKCDYYYSYDNLEHILSKNEYNNFMKIKDIEKEKYDKEKNNDKNKNKNKYDLHNSSTSKIIFYSYYKFRFIDNNEEALSIYNRRDIQAMSDNDKIKYVFQKANKNKRYCFEIDEVFFVLYNLLLRMQDGNIIIGKSTRYLLGCDNEENCFLKIFKEEFGKTLEPHRYLLIMKMLKDLELIDIITERGSKNTYVLTEIGNSLFRI